MTESGRTPSRPVRGDRVRVPKGAYIKTTHPGGDYLLTRTQIVAVHHTFGYGDEPITVCWPGTGGYWREAFEWEPLSAPARMSTPSGEPAAPAEA